MVLQATAILLASCCHRDVRVRVPIAVCTDGAVVGRSGSGTLISELLRRIESIITSLYVNTIAQCSRWYTLPSNLPYMPGPSTFLSVIAPAAFYIGAVPYINHVY